MKFLSSTTLVTCGLFAVQAHAQECLSVGFSAFVGIAFGLYPARRASQLNPIEALRYE